jgi:hypothetical protein
VVRERLLLDGHETRFTAIGLWTFAPDDRIASSRIFVASPDMGPDAWR